MQAHLVRPPQSEAKLFPPCVTGLLIAACVLFLGATALQAQPTLKIHLPFEEESGTTMSSDTTDPNAVAITLTNVFGSSLVPTNRTGAAASGVALKGRALDYSSHPGHAPGTPGTSATVARVLNDSALGFGTVTNWTASFWVKLDSALPGGGLQPRIFVLGAGGTAADVGSLNSIGFKWEDTTRIRFEMRDGTNPTRIFEASRPGGWQANQWFFIAASYDGENGRIFIGTDGSPAVEVTNVTAHVGASANLGAAGYLTIGNRGNDRARVFDGWIDDFRFHLGAADGAFIESLRQAKSPVLLSNIHPNGPAWFQATNTFSFNASSANGIDPSGIQMTLNGVNVTDGLVVGGTPTSRVVTHPLQLNTLYSGATITVTDTLGCAVSAVVGRFDTFDPANYIWESEDYDYGGGLFIDNPQTNAYLSLQGIANVDYIDSNANAVNPYRGDDMSTGLSNDLLRDAYNGTGLSDYALGFFSSGSAANYTRNYPAGLYNIYARVANGNAGSASGVISMITNGWGTVDQSGETLGTVTVPGTGGWSAYSWVAVRDTAGNLMKFNPSAGTTTLRLTSAGDVNYNFFMLTPANTNMPSLSGIYPDGTVQFQPTNKLVFTAVSAAGINSNSIHVALSGTGLGVNFTTNLYRTNGLELTGSASSWNACYPGLVPNAAYTATITVVDQNNNAASTTVRFDTYDPAHTWEAEDFDHSGGQYIDTPQTNGYAGQWALAAIDFHNIANGGETFVYRPQGGGLATEINADIPRRPHVGSGLADYNVGWFSAGEWANYTRYLPAGTYNVFVRAANGSVGSGGVDLSRVTAGAGTETQTLANYGTAIIPPTGGWQVYGWFPFRDGAGNLVQLAGGSTNTLRVTSSGGGQNPNYFMLVPANTNFPTLTQLYPDGTALFQSTNRLSFTASSSAGINTNSVGVTLNGVDVSADLTFAGSPTSWAVSYSALRPGTAYTAVITVTDINGNPTTTTVKFDTFGPGHYTWEGEDYDYDNGMFIDNPQLNAYFGLVGMLGVDYHESFSQIPQFAYRTSDPMGTGVSGDVARPQHSGTSDYYVGWFTPGEWLNFTRHYPAGTYHVYGRMARGAEGSTVHTLSLVTEGWGTSTQTTEDIGTFAINPTGAWQSYSWVQLRDGADAPVMLTLNGGTNTFRLTSGGEANVNFLMLVPALKLTTSLTAGSLNISFPTQPGFSYQAQYKNNLSDPTWTDLGTGVAGDGTVKSVSDSATGANRYYRVEIR